MKHNNSALRNLMEFLLQTLHMLICLSLTDQRRYLTLARMKVVQMPLETQTQEALMRTYLIYSTHRYQHTKTFTLRHCYVFQADRVSNIKHTFLEKSEILYRIIIVFAVKYYKSLARSSSQSRILWCRHTLLREILVVCLCMDKISVVLEYESASLGVWFPYISDSVKVSRQKCRKHSSWTYFDFLKMIPPRCLETSGHRISRNEAPYSRITDTWNFVVFSGLTLLPWLSLLL